MNLRVKFALPVAVISLVLIAFLYGWWFPVHLREAEEEVRSSARAHLASVAESFVPFLLGRQLDAIYENLDALRRRNPDWVAIELADPEGRVLYPLAVAPEAMRPGRDQRVVTHPIELQGSRLGVLSVRVDMGRRLDEIRRGHVQLLVAALAVMAAYFGLLWALLDRGIRGPVGALSRATTRLAAGEYDTPLERSGIAEVDGLVDAFATMRQSIRKYQADLLQAQKMEALGRLAGGIAHDFNNMLSPIVAYAAMAREQVGDNPGLGADLDEVSRAALRARDLVRRILLFSRKAEHRKADVEVAAVAEEVLGLLRASLPASIEIRARLQKGTVVHADATQLHQVLLNLCTNAAHAMEGKGGVLAVSVDPVDVRHGRMVGVELKPGRYALLTVGDTGTGMDPETLARIFDPYFTTKEKGKGTGLGLSVVDGIVRDHDGRVAVYSEPGVGTTFRVYLPVASGAGEQPADVADAAEISGRGERVLFVDDEEPIRAAARRTLGDLGYEVEAAPDAREALAALERDPQAFDLLVTDMTMPGMNGKELARRARGLRPDLPVVVCTGYSSLIDADEARRLGVSALLEKPLLPRDLARGVRRAIDRTPAA